MDFTLIEPMPSTHGTGGLTMSNPADICRGGEVRQRVKELEDAIYDLVSAVNYLEFCTTCYKKSAEFICSGCPWHQAKVKAIRLLAKEE